MTEPEAVTALETALDRWLRAKVIVASGQRSESDRRDLSRRLMELDEAIQVAERFSPSTIVAVIVTRAHQAMAGVSV
ncbi:hypothetical protein [Mesorhizobium sp. A623]